jgi:hypothetical protein
LLVEASVDPDRNPLHMKENEQGGRQGVRIRHHSPPRSEIMKLLWKARIAQLHGREEDAVWCLGRALHYVQDVHVRTGPYMISHDQAESDIGRLRADPSNAVAGAEAAAASPHYVRACMARAKPIRDPRLALDSATLLSSAIASATLSNRSPSPSTRDRWKREGRRHRFVVLPLAIGLPVVLAFGAFVVGVPHYSVLGIPVFLAAICSDSQYYYDREEARWFGMSL